MAGQGRPGDVHTLGTVIQLSRNLLDLCSDTTGRSAHVSLRVGRRGMDVMVVLRVPGCMGS